MIHWVFHDSTCPRPYLTVSPQEVSERGANVHDAAHQASTGAEVSRIKANLPSSPEKDVDSRRSGR